MDEIGIGLVNKQASELTSITYPEWAGSVTWTVGPLIDTDDKGYDVYRLTRDDGGTELEVPSNRIVMMKAFVDRFNS